MSSSSSAAAQLQGLQLHNQQSSNGQNVAPDTLPEQGNQDIRNWFQPNRPRPTPPPQQTHSRTPLSQTTNPPIPNFQQSVAPSPFSPSSTLRTGILPSPQPIVVDPSKNTLPTEVGGIKAKQLGPIVKDFKGDPSTVERFTDAEGCTRIRTFDHVGNRLRIADGSPKPPFRISTG